MKTIICLSIGFIHWRTAANHLYFSWTCMIGNVFCNGCYHFEVLYSLRHNLFAATSVRPCLLGSFASASADASATYRSLSSLFVGQPRSQRGDMVRGKSCKVLKDNISVQISCTYCQIPWGPVGGLDSSSHKAKNCLQQGSLCLWNKIWCSRICQVSLILVDRTLDFASCCPGTGDTLLARATDILPRLPHHSTDLASDLSRLFGLSASGALLPAGIASPSLKYEDKEREEEELEAMLFNPEKETLALLHRNLIASSPQTRRNDAGSKKVVSGAVLSNDLKDFQGDQDALLANLSTISR